MTVVYEWSINRDSDAENSLEEDIEYSIDSHYYSMFMSLRDKYNGNMVNLPQYATVIPDNVTIDITKKENFKKITKSVCAVF